MSHSRNARVLLAALVATVTLGALAPAYAHADAQGRGVSSASAPPAGAALFWCNKTVWKSSPVAATKMLSRLKRVERVADKVDSATTIAGLLFTVVSAGTGAVPSAVVKLVAKGGKWVLKRVVKSLKKQVRPMGKRKVGINVKVKCKWGAPYPSVGVYRP